MGLTQEIEDNYSSIAARFARQVELGRVETDEFLGGGIVDNRRALTLLARPDVDTVHAVATLVEELRPALGAQYVHPAKDLHTTVLSIIPGTDDYAAQADLVSASIESAEQAIRTFGCEFEINYRGIIASSDALIVKGYPEGDALQRLRATLIGELTARGVEQRLSRRYVMIAAHMTMVRFVAQPPDLGALHQQLQRVKNQQFGATRVAQLELVENDWYMRTSTLIEQGRGRYRLQSKPS